MYKRSYSEMIKNCDTFDERVAYLKLSGKIADETFGVKRWLNQNFYKSSEWIETRDAIIFRDLGCEMGLKNKEIIGKIIVHHINPITIEDIINHSTKLLDPENLICVSLDVHNYIHYGTSFIEEDICERKPNDTKLW